MPTSPEARTRWLKRRQAGRCRASGRRAKRSRWSNERQYCTKAGPPAKKPCVTPRKPDARSASSSRIIGRIAVNTGSHLCGFHGRLIRMPMRKTTKSPSRLATRRPGKTGMACPGPDSAVAQDAPQDLAGRELGDLVDELDRAHSLVGRDTLGHPG